jgi:predicted O-linked N-acetylglucosamine transferase (SPINDLY family)
MNDDSMQSPDPLLAEARGLVGAGRLSEARPLLERLASRPGCEDAVIRQLAEIEILTGEPERGIQRLEAMDMRDDLEAAFLVARAEERLGRLVPSRERLLWIRDRLPAPSAMLELQLGIVHQRLGDHARAVAAMREAIRLKPGFTAAHKHLAATLSGAGTPQEARDALEQALAVVPGDPGLWLRLAHVQTQLGDAAGTLVSLERATAAGPKDVDAWKLIGHLYGEHWKFAEADRALAQASALDPGAPDIESLRALVKQEIGDTAAALQALALASARDPDDLRVVIADRLLLPQAYESVEEVARWRSRYEEGLDFLVRERERWRARAAEVFHLEHNNFFLAYQGEDDRELQRKYSGFLASLAATAAPRLREPPAPRFDGNRRLRVGFLGSIFRDSTAGRYFERWVTSLDPQRFERFIYHSAPVVDDFTRRIAAASEHFFPQRLRPRDTAELVRSHRLDVLVYPEVGMSAMTYLLAALRLAPVQCVGWGHPVTTGSDAIDHYFTSGPMEPPGGQDHYTERLIELPGIGVDYAMPEPQPAARRSEFGLPESGRIYMCAQSLFKVHPEMDDLFAEVLARDPEGMLVFFQAPARAVTEQLGARVQRALARRGVPPRGQVKFLPRLSGAYFRSALAIADVVLDTVRWSGGNTSIDAFAAGVPVVTLPGRFMRGRQTSAMLEMMDLGELCATSPEGYVALALDVARERERNAALRKAIVERRETLFNRHECALAFQDALLRVGAG